MPFVQVLSQRFTKVEEEKLVCALQEVIPASLHSEQGPLTPGCLDISRVQVEPPYRINNKFLITIIARDCEDRKENLEERVDGLVTALVELFPELSFAIRLKLDSMIWISHGPKSEAGVEDMSMGSAISRARAVIDRVPG